MNFDSVRSLQNALGVYSARNSVINQNLANVDTPGYKREFIKFEEYLESASLCLSGTTTDKRHIPIPASSQDGYTIEKDASTSSRLDGNNVEADVESAALTENFMRYSAVTQQLNNRFKNLRAGITLGGSR